MRPILFLAAAALLVTGCRRAPEEPAVTVDEAWVRLSPVAGRPGAAYFTLQTNNDPTRLVAITSPKVERIELHDSGMDGGVMRMKPLEPAETTFTGNRLVFEPGARHAMLFGIDPSVEAGGQLELTFHFDPAPPVTVEAEVRGPGDAGHAGH